MRSSRLILAIAAIAFFFTPLVLLAGGARADRFENRRLAARPSMHAGWGVFAESTDYIVDHMPLRERAVHARAWTALNVFHTTPTYNGSGKLGATPGGPSGATSDAAKSGSPAAVTPAPPPNDQVVIGKDDWLYLHDEFTRACYPIMPVAPAIARWERLAATLRSHGRRVVLVIAPDKASIYPEHLSAPMDSCAKAGKQAFWDRVESSREPAMLKARPLLLDARKAGTRRLYHKTDSHWSTFGGILALRAILDRFDVPVPDGDIRRLKDRTWYGDLANLVGAGGHERERRYAIRREDRQPAIHLKIHLRSGKKLPLVRSSRRSSPPLMPGRLVMVHDSYGDYLLPGLPQYTSEMLTAQWSAQSPTDIIEAMTTGDTIILETVERETTQRAASILTPGFFRELDIALAAAPVAVHR